MDLPLRTHWPVDDPDYYFYLEAIEKYYPDCRVDVVGAGQMLMLGSYSYLSLNQHPKINRAAHEAINIYGTGTHGVRLLSGSIKLHRELEARIAAFKRTEAALTFSSGYAANVATIASLLGRKDTVICDKLDHASIVDGCVLSRARLLRFRHSDMEHLERRLISADKNHRILVVADAVYSMDGDILNLPEVSRLCRAYGAWLMVDEAHSIGVLGGTGHGIEEHFGLPSDVIDIKMGTLSKAIPSTGGYIAGKKGLCNYLAHESSAFIYSAAITPPAAASALAALEVIEDQSELVSRLHQNAVFFAEQLRQVKLDFSGAGIAIFPLVLGDDLRAWRVARQCHARSLYVHAIPYPVVSKGSARLRAIVNSGHTRADLAVAARVIREAVDAEDGAV
jgi:glycine C-acetyltransferase